MRLLWITNILFPDACNELGVKSPVTGGWMYSSATTLLDSNKDIVLAVATVYNGETLKVFIKNNIIYYLLPNKRNNEKYNKTLEQHWKSVCKDFNPELIHIYGTEFAHGLALINTQPKAKIVVSIQGLISVIEHYYYGGISYCDRIKNISLTHLLLRNSLFQQKKDFKRRGKIEHKIISKVNHVIGRTSWDKTHALAINPNIHYHFCNETLRESFYNHIWSYENCEKHSIFLSQADYPIKGLHKVLMAIPLILKEYPDTKIYIAGRNIIKNNKNFIRRLLMNEYGRHINSLVEKYNLHDKVIFTGLLNEQQICQRYLKSNVFVCPSSIENSPNSLGEAQLLGVPSIASYVGGTPDMMTGAEEYLYRFEEIEQMAYKICRIFKDYTNYPSVKMRKEAQKRHNASTNSNTLVDCYNKILTLC